MEGRLHRPARKVATQGVCAAHRSPRSGQTRGAARAGTVIRIDPRPDMPPSIHLTELVTLIVLLCVIAAAAMRYRRVR